MTLKLVRQKAVYLLVAASVILMLLGTPLVTPPAYAGDCPLVSLPSC